MLERRPLPALSDGAEERSSGVLGGRVAFAHAAGRSAPRGVAAITFVILASASCAGCVSSGAFEIERTVGGSRRLGAFVAPSSYEHFIRKKLHHKQKT